ncbi:hypothetical protein [Streptomyces sindenensis]|uniref:hypothetical protein n=1 Tax=Streptomyces sindenensis TaxID=67363 RepID=UPI001672477D|nr:hypothetical protein [Streptomyces sindenensis]
MAPLSADARSAPTSPSPSPSISASISPHADRLPSESGRQPLAPVAKAESVVLVFGTAMSST